MAGRKSKNNRPKAPADRHVQAIVDLLRQSYLPEHPGAEITVYRYNSVSIRIRIIDPDFAGQDLTDRDTLLWRVLDTLPEETVSEISLLLLLTPEEAKRSLMNLEFDDPTPTRL